MATAVKRWLFDPEYQPRIMPWLCGLLAMLVSTSALLAFRRYGGPLTPEWALFLGAHALPVVFGLLAWRRVKRLQAEYPNLPDHVSHILDANVWATTVVSYMMLSFASAVLWVVIKDCHP